MASTNRYFTPLLLALLSFFTFFTTYFWLAKTNSLYWDNLQFYSIFRDQLHSLNHFGEFAWWYPHFQSGYPGYFYAILGQIGCASPLMILLGSAVWLLGKLGITINQFYGLYVFYSGFLAPFLLILSTFLLSRRLFKSKYAMAYVTIGCAFSPLILLNVSDPGCIEPAAYGLFFLCALHKFLEKPSLNSYVLLTLSICTLAISLTFSTMFWNMIGIPLFSCAFIWQAMQKNTNLWKNIKKSIPRYGIAISIVFILICLSPIFMTYMQKGDLVRALVNSHSYSLNNLRSGNPIEALSASFFGLGVEWVNQNRFWSLKPLLGGGHIAITYLGLTCLPFCFMALIYSTKKTKTFLFCLFLICFGVIILSAQSPIFLPFLSLIKILRANNHFSDLFYRCGGFFILLYSSAVGVDLLAQKPAQYIGMFKKSLLILMLTNASLHLLFFKSQALSIPTFGLSIFLFLLYWVLACWINQNKDLDPSWWKCFLFLIIIDLSLHTGIHSKFVSSKGVREKIYESDSPNQVGMARVPTDPYAGRLISYKSYLDFKNLDFQNNTVPLFKLFTSITFIDDYQKFKKRFGNSLNRIKSLPFEKNSKEKLLRNNFPYSMNGVGLKSEIKLLSQSYNSVRAEIISNQNALLFIGQGFSPYWKIKLNQKTVVPQRVLKNFMVIHLPEGKSHLSMQFSPPWITFLLFISYAILLLMATFLIRRKRLIRAS